MSETTDNSQFISCLSCNTLNQKSSSFCQVCGDYLVHWDKIPSLSEPSAIDSSTVHSNRLSGQNKRKLSTRQLKTFHIGCFITIFLLIVGLLSTDGTPESPSLDWPVRTVIALILTLFLYGSTVAIFTAFRWVTRALIKEINRSSDAHLRYLQEQQRKGNKIQYALERMSDFSAHNICITYEAVNTNIKQVGIAIDVTRKKACFFETFNKSNEVSIEMAHGSEILSIDIVQDHDEILKSSTSTANMVSRALVGGALLGAGGAVVGAATAKKKYEHKRRVKRHDLRIITTNPTNPVKRLNLLGREQEAEQLYGLLLIIKSS